MGLVLVLGLTAVMACYDDPGDGEVDNDQFREDVLRCEDALARLQSCCPGFDPSPIDCHYFHSSEGCGGGTTDVRPALSVDESKCIAVTSCEALVTNGICERAQLARETRISTTDNASSSASTASSSTDTSEESRVCP